MLPAAIGHDEVEEPVRERRPGDGDAELGGIGEVGECHAARLGRLAEDDVAGGAMERAPVAHPPLQRPAAAVVGEGVGVGHLQMTQQRHRLNGRFALQDRQQHRLPDRGQRIGDGAATLGLALGRQAQIRVDPAPGAFAEPGPGGGGALAVTMSILHVHSRLLVGDGFARHDGTSVWIRRSLSHRPAAVSTHAYPPRKTSAPPSTEYGRATPALRLETAANMVVGTGLDGCR